MKTRTKTSLITLAILIMGIVIGALLTGTMQRKKQAHYREMNRHERFAAVLERIIQPTTEQRQQIEQVLDKRYDQITGLRETYQEQIFSVYDSMRIELGNVLTPEQQARLEEHLSRGPRSALEQRLDHLSEDLNLSDTQKEQIREIMTNSFRDFQPRPPGKRDSRPGPDRQTRRTTFTRMESAIEAVLTPEQVEQFRKIKKHRRGFPGPPNRRGAHGGFGPPRPDFGRGEGF